ncbi:MAG TPA: type II toxin-antitoxin system prevent-host-death family antitoxin [Gemmatimonadales bacterium]|jgi:prevent-host-death family protein|nr:type II toxin-antitoxin system prevent-host-death family antitoxin [Gemmatimonadales bacterium]
MDEYSTYDAKARFSELLRKVREGKSVTISYHGRPVAELRPIAPAAEDAASRVARLAQRGILVRPTVRRVPLRPVAHRAGGLGRFLRDRDE